jgi:F0F1-type ATP synthase assembly protein I
MKFLWAMLAHLLICVVLGWGILLTVKGQPWVLIAVFLAYLVAFVRIGCLPQKTH